MTRPTMEQMRKKADEAAEWYGGIPGSGPEGMTCWFCGFFRMGHNRDVCEKARKPRHIRKSTPACSRFEEDHL